MQTRYGRLGTRRRHWPRRFRLAGGTTTLVYGTLSIVYGGAFYVALALAWLRDRTARGRRLRTARHA
jgi:hypothetical protein